MKVGVLVPSTDTTLERELPWLLRDTASTHFTRMRLPSVTPDGLAEMERAAYDGADLLADIRPDVVLFGCTSGSFFRGAAHEKVLAAELAERAGAPVVTTARAMVEALVRRGRRVRLRTPYTSELTAAEVAYLQEAGLVVTSAAGMDLVDDLDIGVIESRALIRHAEGTESADVLMLSCTNVPTLNVRDQIAEATGLPVVTSNSASAEAVISMLAGM